MKMHLTPVLTLLAPGVVLATLLAALPAHASITFYTEAGSSQQFGGPMGPFAAQWDAQTTSERRECRNCPADLPQREPGYFSTYSGSTNHSWGVDRDGHYWDYSSSQSNRDGWPVLYYPGDQMAIATRSFGANVLQSGFASVRASAYGEWGNVSGGFSSSSNAGWNDGWLIAPTTEHEAGSAGRIQITLDFSGEMTSNVPIGEGNPQVQTALAEAKVGSFVAALGADWTYERQEKTTSLYVDFRYGESFAAKLLLSTSATVSLDGDLRNGAGLFEAGISEVLIPLGTTMEHSLLGLNVLNSDDPNLNPHPPVPEPGTWALMLAGLAGVGIIVRRRTKDSATPETA